MSVSVVYPLLQAGIELKYSVRSLLLHGRNVGDIFVIGDLPPFFHESKFVHIPFHDKTGRAYENVWGKLEAIARDERITERLLWMNDDFYIRRDFDATAVPNYSRSLDLAHMPKLHKEDAVLSPYKQVLKRTHDALVRRGMSTFHFGTHQPVNYEKRKMLETIEEFRSEIPSKLSFRCCYMNMHQEKRTPQSTVVVKHVDAGPPNRWAFASRATADLSVLERGLAKLFPHRSELEN